jgi:hypothetical protein
MSEPNYPKAPGIYCLEINGYKYIGHSRQLNKRLGDHKSKLRNNNHKNKKLQNYYNKYPEVKISIIQILDISKFSFTPSKTQITHILKIIEQTYFNLIDPALNLHLDVFSLPTIEWTKTRRDKLRASRKGKPLSETARLLISNPYYLVSPEGEVFEGKNITQFCKEKNLNASAIGKLIKGKFKQFKNWTTSIRNFKLLKEGKLRRDGVEEKARLFKPGIGFIEIEDLPIWCKENNYKPQCIRRVLLGQRKSSYGYYLSDESYMEYLNSKISVHKGVSYNNIDNRWVALKSTNAYDSLKKQYYFKK